MLSITTCLASLFLSSQIGMASRFGDRGDTMAGGPMMCRDYMSRQVFRSAARIGCAHRTLPCGTRLLVAEPRSGRRAMCVVVDRGPYGAIHEGRWVLKTRSDMPGRWRGIIDLRPTVANQLGIDGIHPVVMRVMESFTRPVWRPEPRS